MLRASLFFALVAATACSNAAGEAFLAKNKQKEGVVSLPSGLQYKVLRAGGGTDHPAKDSPCECHYEGRTAQEFEKAPTGDNTFDSSYKRGSPTTFAPNQVIKGWTEAMQLMVEGDKWELYIPSELGYGERGSGSKIGGGDVLVFTIEILEITGGRVTAIKCDVATLDGCDEKDKKYLASWRSGSRREMQGKELTPPDLEREISRLGGLASRPMGATQRENVNRRLVLLNRLKAEL